MIRKRRLELDELDEVSVVDTPAVGDALMRITKRDETKVAAPPTADNEIDEQLTVAALHVALAKR